MTYWILIILLVLVAVAGCTAIDVKRRRRMARYWMRTCTGFEWRRQFRDVPKTEIREFLEQFVDGFAFSSKKRLRFSPADKVMDVYRALYPPGTMVDALELETFAGNLRKKYGIDLAKLWRPDITLGELFAMTRR
jgi:hypothetical protein